MFLKNKNICTLEGKSVYEYDEAATLRKTKHSRFSFVYKGYDKINKCPVVIKMLNPRYEHNAATVAKFEYEASLDFAHPYIQKNIDFIKKDGKKFIIKEYAYGVDLLYFSKKNKLHKNIKLFQQVFTKVLEALDYLHELEYIHGDIKPANIIVDRQQDALNIKLIDFGQTQKFRSIPAGKKKEFAMFYSPPEQLLKAYKLFDQTTDFYSLGMTMYHALAGKLPFSHIENPFMLLQLQLNYKLNPHRKISEPVMKIIQKATEKYIFPKPYTFFSREEVLEMLQLGQKKRFQSAKEFIETLQSLD